MNFLLRKISVLILIFFSTLLILNYVKIIQHVNSKYSCRLNQEKEDERLGHLRIKFPHVFETLPHLKQKFHLLKPRHVLTKSKQNVSLVVGVSTVKRENVTYLYRTLDTLFSGMNSQEKAQSLVVVLVAEVLRRFLF